MKKNEIYDELLKRIVRGIYRPGEIIREADLAEEFHVSRTPIREVLQDLQRVRLITLYRYQGAQVTFVLLEFYYQVIAVKEELEDMAQRLAAKRISPEEIAQLRALQQECAEIEEKHDPQKYFEDMLRIDTEFHRIVRKASGNQFLYETMEELQMHVERYYYYTRGIAEKTLVGFTQQFSAIIDALEQHDVEGAAEALHNHMHAFYDITGDYYKPIM